MPLPLPATASRLPQINTRSRSPVKNSQAPTPSSSITDTAHNASNATVASSSTAPAANTRASVRARSGTDGHGERPPRIKPGTSSSRQTSPSKIVPPKTGSKPASHQRVPSTRRASQTRPPSSGQDAAPTVRAPAPSKAAAPPSSFKAPLPPARSSSNSSSVSRSRPGSSSGPQSAAPSTSTTRTSRPNSSQSQSKPPSRPPSASNSSQAGPAVRTQPARTARPLSFHAPASSLSTSPPKQTPAKPAPVHRRNAASVSTPSSASSKQESRQPALKRKPAFTSHTQHFSPAKPAPPAQPCISPAVFRAQQTLLHLALLHASFTPTRKAWVESARRQLRAQHESLSETYHQSLLLSRMARQQRNLLALTKWTGGNTVSLVRKLGALCAVLDGVTTLVEPRGAGFDRHRREREREEQVDQEDYTEEHDAEHTGLSAPHAHSEGEYITVVHAFTEWVSYVLSIWEERDAEAAHLTSSLDETSDGSAPMYPSSGAAPQTQAQPASKFREIEGLGDAVNAQIKSLMSRCTALRIRLDEVGDIPADDLETAHPDDPAASASAAQESQLKDQAPPTRSKSTPAALIEYTSLLLHGMQEELQLMREIEAEAVIGEKAYVEERVRRLRDDAWAFAPASGAGAGGGYATPRALGHAGSKGPGQAPGHKRVGSWSREIPAGEGGVFSPGWIGM